LLECGTARVVVFVSWVVYPTTFPPKLSALFHVELGIFFFFGLPLVLSAPRILARELAHDRA
jgi:hypothetical protein